MQSQTQEKEMKTLHLKHMAHRPHMAQKTLYVGLIGLQKIQYNEKNIMCT